MTEHPKLANQVNILVVGDIMLDRYIVGDVTRISPEAPVPIVNVKEKYSTLGGASNVANNIAALGAKVTIISQYGDDEAGSELKQHMIDNENIDFSLFNNFGSTIVKERIISTNRQVQMLRVDTEEIKKFDATRLNNQTVEKKDYDIVIVSDYGKGMVSQDLLKYFAKFGDIILDPKPVNAHMYRNLKGFTKRDNWVEIITPNETEFNEMTKNDPRYFNHFSHVVKTLGKKGMVYRNTSKIDYEIKSQPVDIYNVSGAGDTVVAILGVCIAKGYDLVTSARVANECARYVVSQPGTSVVPKNIFNESLERVVMEL